MDPRPAGRQYLEILLFALVSVTLYWTRVGLGLFLVPLQVVAVRRGMPSLLAAATALLVAIIALQLLSPLLVGEPQAPMFLFMAEVGTNVLLLLGMLLANLSFPKRPRTLVMLLAATALSGVVAAPAILWLSGNAAFQLWMDNQYVEVSKTITAMLATTDAVSGSLLSSMLLPSKLREIVETVLLRCILPGYFCLLAFSWWAGQAMASRPAALLGGRLPFRFSRLKLESWWLWPLLFAGALVLADLFFGISFGSFVAWNLTLVFLLLYGLQGMAILRFLFEKYRIPRFLWLLLVVVVVTLVRVSPGAGLFVVLAIPLLGISEIWIRYRIPRDPAPSEES